MNQRVAHASIQDLTPHSRGVPAYAGAMIGHQERQFTLPIGGLVEVDAAAGTIQMLEPAVL